MTEKAHPSVNRPAEAFKTSGNIAAEWGDTGWVVDGANPTDIATQDGGITEGNLSEFSETSSASSFDVDISAGEAFVYGSWVAKDTTTTVSLASSTNNQTVYVGWNKDGADDVIIGLDAAFSSATGDTDKKIPIWEFDTDGSGVTAARDQRKFYPESIETKFNTMSIPLSAIGDGDNASVRANIPSGETMKVWEVGVQDDSQNAPAGLTIDVYDITNATSVYSANAKIDQGYPLAEKAGAIDISCRVSNSTGSSINASGYVVYTSE